MEKYINRRNGLVVAGLGVAAALLMSGCAGQESGDSAPEPSEQVSVGHDQDSPLVSTEYYPNGTRFVCYDSENGLKGKQCELGYTLGYCEGGDLIEFTRFLDGYGGGGGAQRSVGHAACADNRLTQQDFPPLPQ